MSDTEVVEHAGDVTEVDEGPVPLPALPVPVASTALVARQELTVDDIVEQMKVIEKAIAEVMKEGVHYGTIPGTRQPTLYQPGAQKLNVLFRLAPSFRTERTWHEDGHLTVVSTCLLTHIPTGLLIATGDGLCSTRESRYAFRNAGRVCPACGGEFIKQGKTRTTPAVDQFYCYRKVGGCGWTANAGTVEYDAVAAQEVGKKDNPDLADLFNTVLKMANKRALVAATINGTAASDMFTQDVEDIQEHLQQEGRVDPHVAANARHSAGGPTATAPVTVYVPPATPTEMMRRLALVLGGEHDALAWVQEAAEMKHGVPAVGEIPQPVRTEFLNTVAKVLRVLETENERGEIAFRASGVRDLVATTFRDQLNVALIGPRWRVDPSEETLPTHAEYAAGAGATDATADDDEIPF